jgi:hypothetical protein
MLPSSDPPTLLLVLTEKEDPLRVTVPLDGFLRFAEQVTRGLEAVVHRWQHRAAPVARVGMLHRGTWHRPS